MLISFDTDGGEIGGRNSLRSCPIVCKKKVHSIGNRSIYHTEACRGKLGNACGLEVPPSPTFFSGIGSRLRPRVPRPRVPPIPSSSKRLGMQNFALQVVYFLKTRCSRPQHLTVATPVNHIFAQTLVSHTTARARRADVQKACLRACSDS